MKSFEFIKKILLQIQQKDKLVEIKPLKEKKGNFLILRYIDKRGLEQDILTKELKYLVETKKMPENFYAYLVWIAGEIVNNIFDHGQTLGRTLRGGILGLVIRKNNLELVIGDLGIGIKSSLEKNTALQAKNLNSKKAIQLALKENISGWPHKRGNGLPDALRVIQAGQGKFWIYSDQMLLKINNGRKKWEQIKQNLAGVLIGVELKIKDFQVPRKNQPKGLAIKLSKFGLQLSGREKGQEAYEILVKELTSLPKQGVLMIDLTGVIMMNSSFGDQALGVLLENIQQGHFGAKKVFFIGEIKQAVDLCLDRIAEIRKVEIAKI